MESGELTRLVAGVPLVVIVPAIVELAKGQGLGDRYAGLASIGAATFLLVIADIAAGGVGAGGIGGPHWLATVAGWLAGGIVYGLAGSGLYSQRGRLPALRRPGRTDGDAGA